MRYDPDLIFQHGKKCCKILLHGIEKFMKYETKLPGFGTRFFLIRYALGITKIPK